MYIYVCIILYSIIIVYHNYYNVIMIVIQLRK